MLIAQITDTHILSLDPAEPKSLSRKRDLEQFVAHILALDEKPDVVIHTGDITHGGTPELYDIVKSALSQLPMPVFFALGNRDNAQNLMDSLEDISAIRSANGFVMYSVEDFPIRLIAMDTQSRDSNIGTACSVRLKTLDKMLKEHPDVPTAIFMHHPPFEVTTSKYPFQFEDKTKADAFLDLVASHKQVVHMFCGHAHRPYSVDLETCVATVSPSLPVNNRVEKATSTEPLYQLHRWNVVTARFETKTHEAKL